MHGTKTRCLTDASVVPVDARAEKSLWYTVVDATLVPASLDEPERALPLSTFGSKTTEATDGYMPPPAPTMSLVDSLSPLTKESEWVVSVNSPVAPAPIEMVSVPLTAFFLNKYVDVAVVPFDGILMYNLEKVPPTRRYVLELFSTELLMTEKPWPRFK